MKAKILSFVIALLVLFSFSTAFGQSPKPKSPLTSVDLGLTLRINYDISGLGNVDNIDATLNYTANVASLCYNSGRDAGPVPGQDQSFSATPQQVVIPVHNGRARGFFTSTEVFSAGACPNSKNWTGVVSGVSFSSITLTINGVVFPVSNP